MQRNRDRKKWKKVRRLWEEYRKLTQPGQTLQITEARIRDEAETPTEKRNVQIVRALLDERVGGEPESHLAESIWSPGLQTTVRGRFEFQAIVRQPLEARELQAPFLQIAEEEYLRRSGLQDYYADDPEWKDKEGRRVITEDNVYSLRFQFLSGWVYLPPEHKRISDSKVRSRQADIKRRIVEISGMDFWTARRVANNSSTRFEPGYTRGRYIKREAIRRETTEEEAERARVDLLEERRGKHRYWEETGAADREQRTRKSQRAATSEEISEATEEKIDDYRRPKTQVPIKEKLSA